jgi:protein O-GlcNAc transferase
LAIVFTNLGQMDEAIAKCKHAVELNPGFSDAWISLGNAYKATGRLDGALDAFQRALFLQPDRVDAHSNLVFTMQYHPRYGAEEIKAALHQWNEQHAAMSKKLIRPHSNSRDAERPLRIGYFGADFRNHCQSFFTIPLFSNHDENAFEVHCYSRVTCPDAITERMRGMVKQMRSVVGMTEESIADVIQADEIDILVDLTMHMSEGRPLVFCSKPAPVQIAWLAYPGSTGLNVMDYRLTDPYLDPPGTDYLYTEKSIRLPDTFWCYDPLCEAIDPQPLPAIRNGFVTFGSLNNFCKVNDGVLRLWAQVLKAVEQSRLIVMCPNGSHRQSLMDVFQQEGIDQNRIELVSRQPRRAYLELYRRIDIGLDTFPYNGHTTSLDSFWMGVPVVTLVGTSVVGRAGLSQLSNLNLIELITHSPEQFVEIAAILASDLSRLLELRRTLRTRMETSPLMDASRFARNIEAAYRQMWQNWCANQV